MTVTVTGAVWVSEPDVPVTMTVTCCGDGVELVELLLPHPRANSEMKSSKPKRLIHRTLLRVSGFRLRVVRRVPNSPRPESSMAMP